MYYRCYVEVVKKNHFHGQVFASALSKLDTLLADINGQLDRAVLFKFDFDKEPKDYGPNSFTPSYLAYHSSID